MKRFIDYLIESAEAKKYAFKIKIAGELPENCEDCMEAALQKYSVSRFTKGKSTPIQENLLDFPEVKNAEMTVFEAEVDYPATSMVIAELISNATGIAKNRIRVRTPQEEANWEIEHEHDLKKEEETKDSKPLLHQDYEKSNAQDLVGEKFVSGFLKDLVKVRKETAPSQYKGANDELLAKKLHKEKADVLPAAGPARSLFGGSKKD
jgi:hypothetical protein